MVAIQNAKHVFKKAPTGYPEPDVHTGTDTSGTIDLDTVPLNGGFLVKTLTLSIDPYMRHMMIEPDKTSNEAAYAVGEPFVNFGIGVVLRSENGSIKVGQHIRGMFQFVEYFVGSDPAQFRVLPEEPKVPLSVYVGALGLAGESAVYAWKEYSQAKKGEVVFVSAGAGAVGSVVIQIAKQQGLKVIGSAGSDEKVQFMKEIGADVAFNYKTQSTKEVLQKEGPIDIYFDNVGGETFEAALDNAAAQARFIECGMISGYNSKEPYGIKNLYSVIGKSIHIHGFSYPSVVSKYQEEFFKTMPAEVASGKIKYAEHRYKGLGQVGQAISDIQRGRNTGKSVIIVADH